MRRRIIAGNWKMYKTISEAIELANGLKRELYKIDDVGIIICPPFTALDEIAEVTHGSNIGLGAQNMHWAKEGAYTGEVSAVMIKDLGCQYVILGHSERRQYFRETNEIVNKKVKAALENNLSAIVCVGENLKEREAENTFDIVRNHIAGSLAELSPEDMKKVIIAYEPVWAIGTGKTATPQQAQEVHAFIRKQLEAIFKVETSQNSIILYGGSVKPANIKELIEQPDIDGALVGGASLDCASFSEIVKKSSKKGA